MGATDFRVTVKANGRTPREAFNDLVEDARAEHGSDGYTGTIAEKDRYKFGAEVKSREEAMERADARFEDDRMDKYGPAVYYSWTEAGEEFFLFFGVAAC